MITLQKQGVIFSLDDNRTQSPTAILISNKIRIYYSSRIEGKSHIYYIEISPETFELGKYKAKPVLSPGEPGSFDENGCVPGCVDNYDHKTILYYTGFGKGKSRDPYSLDIGCAVSSDDGETFTKVDIPPRANENNYWVATSPFCFRESNKLDMWFSEGSDWYDNTPVYKIKSILSYDVLESLARPAIVKLGNKYCMWFSVRQAEDFRGGKGSYRMGYAESTDLKIWQRDDSKAGIDIGEPGEFDSEMMAYPSIVRIENKLFMFYSGNNFGQTGIGLATAEI